MTDFKEADIDRAVRQVILAMNAHQWTAVGYLAEAAEACLPNHLSAAEELRLERLVLMDDPKNKIYPMPIYAEGRDETFVGRIRRDESVTNGISMWVVSDNVRKGAALNSIQIAEILIAEYLN